ncbi:MAG: MerR family transcriptional regulator [Fusicatenibacter sp.]|nr:MerR family transcriptional regulator [Lachnospiraceae bacterium]MDY2937242.1 MerR family transcriptional regulator [Fusicatenibacter sp.]
MENDKYLISEAEKLTGEKAHVLRYWEEELGLVIGRNPMGHRYYTTQDIQIFLSIKELKKKGLHLKAIRDLLPKLREATAKTEVLTVAMPNEEPEIVCDLMPQGAEKITEEVLNSVRSEEKEEFYRILDRLIDQILLQRKQEERYRRVDEAIRRRQQSHREAAAALEQNRKRRKKNA